MGKTIYLDNNATTMVAPEVVEAMLPFFMERYGNPSSIHSFGGNVGKSLDRAREQVAAFLGGRRVIEQNITGPGTASDNHDNLGPLSKYWEKLHMSNTTREYRNVCPTWT